MALKVDVRLKTAKDLIALRGSPFLKKVKFFWRKGWTEIPVLMGGSFLVIAGFGMTSFTVYYGLTHDLTPKYYEDIRNRTIHEFRRSVPLPGLIDEFFLPQSIAL